MHTEKMPCEDESGDQGDAAEPPPPAPRQEKGQRLRANHQKLEERYWTDFSFTALKRNQPF